MTAEHAGARVRVQGPRCPYCHDGFRPEEEKRGCEVCLAWYHRECWDEHPACAACSTAHAPAGGLPAWLTCATEGCADPAVGAGRVVDKHCLIHARKEAAEDRVAIPLGGLIFLTPLALFLLWSGHPGWATFVAGLAGSALLHGWRCQRQLRRLAKLAPRDSSEAPTIAVPADATRCCESGCRLPVHETGDRCLHHALLDAGGSLDMLPVWLGVAGSGVVGGGGVGLVIALTGLALAATSLVQAARFGRLPELDDPPIGPGTGKAPGEKGQESA